MEAEKGLHILRWQRVRLTLTNTRNIYAREHPLAIFESVFKEARSLPSVLTMSSMQRTTACRNASTKGKIIRWNSSFLMPYLRPSSSFWPICAGICTIPTTTFP